MLPQSHNFVVIDLWFKIFPRCETCTVIRTNFSILRSIPSAPVSSSSVYLFFSLSHTRFLPFFPSLSFLRWRPSHPTDKTSSSTPFLTPSPIPCHLYTIFLVIANIHLRRAPSISRYPNLRGPTGTQHPHRASVVLPSSAYNPSTEARRLLLLIYDGYLQDHARRVKTFYNCATPCVVLLLLAITPSHSEMFLKVSSRIGRADQPRGQGSRRKSPEAVAETCPAVITRSAFTLPSYYTYYGDECARICMHCAWKHYCFYEIFFRVQRAR